MMQLRRVLVPSLLLLATVSMPALAGDLKGKVVIKTPLRTRAVGPRAARYPTHPPEEDEVQNVVVYLEKVDAKAFKAPTAHATMAQQGKTLRPDVLPIVAGQTVDFPNQDPIYHDLYSESAGNQFEMTGYKGGDTRSRAFDQPGVVELFCAIHGSMNGYVLVLQNPFFAKPDASHQYTISNIPAGHYVVKAWHPRLDPKTVTNVVVPAKGAVKLDFEL